MQSIQLKGSAVPASTANRPAVSNTPWRNKLEASHSDALAKLLQRAGILGNEQYCDAAEIAESINKSIDHVLASSFLNDKQTELCASAMQYIERGILTEQLAADALAVANHKQISFAEGLKYYGFGW
jgi:hypothetical protein